MRHTIPRVSYYVVNQDYDLPKLFPSCLDAMDSWLRHCLTRHDFVACRSFEDSEDSYMVISTDIDRYFLSVLIRSDSR